MEGRMSLRKSLILCGATATATLAGAILLSREPAPRPAVARTPVISEPQLVMNDSSLSHREEQPRLDPQMLEAALAQAGVTPERAAAAKTDARNEALETIRGTADPFAKRVAIFHLWNTRQVDDKAVEEILAMLDRTSDEELVAQALYAMKDSPRADVSAITQTYLSQSSSKVVRLAAAKALHFRPGDDVTRTLANHLPVEQDPIVRKRTLLALGTRALSDAKAKEAVAAYARHGADPALCSEASQILADNAIALESIGRR